MAVYRKTKGKDVWHWCENCRYYPAKEFDERKTKPRKEQGNLCTFCGYKEKKGNCSKK